MADTSLDGALERLVVVDIETTGLDLAERPIEFGIMVTDLDGKILDVMTEVLWDKATAERFRTIKRLARLHEEQGALGIDDGNSGIKYVYDMHLANGLWEVAEAAGSSIKELDAKLVEFIVDNGLGKNDPVVGSTINFDRKFMEKYFPTGNKLLSHRNIDVSSFSEAAKRFAPRARQMAVDTYEPSGEHRVLGDMMDTMRMLQSFIGLVLTDERP